MKVSKNGILYVLLIELEDKQLVKIGITTRSIEERVSEILLEVFKKYRYFPYCRPKRFRNTSDIAHKEKTLHKIFKDKQYKTSKKFGGHTELFDVPLEDVVLEYEKIIKDVVEETVT